MAGPLKPPFAYYGGKTTLAPEIARLLPKHDHYVEPFAGSLAVLLAKNPAGWETVNDLDGDLVTFWRVLRDKPEELARVCMLTPHARDEVSLPLDVELPDLERARRVFVKITQNRTNSLRGGAATDWRFRKNHKSYSGNPQHSQVDPLLTHAARIEDAAKRLHRVSIENRDALELIHDYGTEPTVCIYADPPYLGSTRGGGYRAEMLGDDLHVKLADALRNCKASVVLSGYASPLYEELFDGWHRMELKAPTALSGRAAENEVLWSNVPLGAQEAFDFGAIA